MTATESCYNKNIKNGLSLSRYADKDSNNMFSQLIKLIRVLSSEVSPLQISAGFSLAMVMGLSPIFSLHNILVVFLLLILRINFSAFILALALFSLSAYALDPVFNQLGEYLLQRADLSAFWTQLYNIPLARLAQFNNTLVLGSLTFSLIAFFPMLFLGNVLISRYREHVVKTFKNSRLYKFISTNKWFTRIVSIAE